MQQDWFPTYRALDVCKGFIVLALILATFYSGHMVIYPTDSGMRLSMVISVLYTRQLVFKKGSANLLVCFHQHSAKVEVAFWEIL